MIVVGGHKEIRVERFIGFVIPSAVVRPLPHWVQKQKITQRRAAPRQIFGDLAC